MSETLPPLIPPGSCENPPALVSWGDIQGTLSNQTDLQTELDGKAPLIHGHPISDITGLQQELDDLQDEIDAVAEGGSEAILRTAAEGPPTDGVVESITSSTTVTVEPGSTETMPTLLREGEANSRARYRSEGYSESPRSGWQSEWDGVQWITTYHLVNTIWYSSVSPDNVLTPDLATFEADTVNSGGTGIPDFDLAAPTTLDPIPGFIGQWCRVGDVAPYDWYQANTDASWVLRWTLGGPAGPLTAQQVIDPIKGAVADPAKIGTEYMPDSQEFESITFEDGSDVTLPDGSITSGPGNNGFYRHNGIDKGGIPTNVAPRNSVQNAVNVSVAEQNNWLTWTRLSGTCATPGTMIVNLVENLVEAWSFAFEIASNESVQDYLPRLVDTLNNDPTYNANHWFTGYGNTLQVQEKVYTGVADFFVNLVAGTATGVDDAPGKAPSLQYRYCKLGSMLLRGSEVAEGKEFIFRGKMSLKQGTINAASLGGTFLLFSPVTDYVSVKGAGGVDDASTRFNLTESTGSTDPVGDPGGYYSTVDTVAEFEIAPEGGSLCFFPQAQLATELRINGLADPSAILNFGGWVQPNDEPGIVENRDLVIDIGACIVISPDITTVSQITADVTLVSK